MRVVGIDLSLTATGVAGESGTSVLHTSLRGCERLAWIRDRICGHPSKEYPCGSAVFPEPPPEWWESADPMPQADLVVIEGYSYASANQAHQVGELGGVVRLALHESGVPFVDVAPSCLKKYATGHGNAPKAEVLAAAIRRLGYDGHDDNEADALWLRTMALDWYGAVDPPVPESHRTALTKVDFPPPASPIPGGG